VAKTSARHFTRNPIFCRTAAPASKRARSKCDAGATMRTRSPFFSAGGRIISTISLSRSSRNASGMTLLAARVVARLQDAALEIAAVRIHAQRLIGVAADAFVLGVAADARRHRVA